MGLAESAAGTVGGAVRRRTQGERPGAVRAAAGAVVAGAATGVVVYRLLRHGGDQA
jgi:hypothetical protein